MERDFKGIWIPKELIKIKGCRNAALISALHYRAPNLTVSQIREAKQKHFITRKEIDSTEIAEQLKRKKLKGKGIGFLICEWCETNTITLHKHHYPVEARYGGTSVVRICPNCHQEFHSLKDIYSFILTDELRRYYE